jgi:hypothetical protein
MQAEPRFSHGTLLRPGGRPAKARSNASLRAAVHRRPTESADAGDCRATSVSRRKAWAAGVSHHVATQAGPNGQLTTAGRANLANSGFPCAAGVSATCRADVGADRGLLRPPWSTVRSSWSKASGTSIRRTSSRRSPRTRRGRRRGLDLSVEPLLVTNRQAFRLAMVEGFLVV